MLDITGGTGTSTKSPTGGFGKSSLHFEGFRRQVRLYQRNDTSLMFQERRGIMNQGRATLNSVTSIETFQIYGYALIPKPTYPHGVPPSSYPSATYSSSHMFPSPLSLSNPSVTRAVQATAIGNHSPLSGSLLISKSDASTVCSRCARIACDPATDFPFA